LFENHSKSALMGRQSYEQGDSQSCVLLITPLHRER